MRGDLVLYRAGTSWQDKVIAMATGGPFVHVEIDLGEGTFIGAHDEGISKVGAAQADENHVYTTPRGSQADIEAGLKWAISQLGDPYSWIDIFDDGSKYLHLTWYLGVDKSYDCSDFATRYLIVAHSDGPLGQLATHPETVSPNDIARAFKVK